MGVDFDSRTAVALAIVTLIVLLLIWWSSRHPIACAPSIPVSAADKDADRDVVSDILVVCSCPDSIRARLAADNPLLLTIDALREFLAQLDVVTMANPRKGAYYLHHHVLDGDEFLNLIPLVESIPSDDPWIKKATKALGDLPRHIRLLGVHLELYA